MAWKHLLFRLRMLRSALTIKPAWGGSPDDDDSSKDDDKPDDDAKDDADKADDTSKDDDGDKVDKDDDWQTKARKHERAQKRERKAREEAERKLKERDDADKTEQEKALDKAREEARKEAQTEGDKERRSDRLENATLRLAGKGFKIGAGDDAKTLRFADPDDAFVYIERAITKDDLDPEDIFDAEGKVKTDALQKALGDLLQAKPHLVAGEQKQDPGDPDTGKGDPKDNDLESMSPEDHAKRKYPAPTK